MKRVYVSPVSKSILIITEKFLCQSNVGDSASIGGTGSPNEQNQDDIQTGGPGVSGAKEGSWMWDE